MTDAELDQCRRDGVLLRSIISQQVKLKRAGRDWKGCCPFHEDNTPSFTVFGDGHFHCFGCGAHGTVFDFVMLRDGIEFPEAAGRVAAERGLATPKPRKNGNGAHHAEVWQPIVPPSADAPKPTEAQLRCDMLHEYHDTNDRLLFFIRRIEAQGDQRKQFIPLTYGTLAKNGRTTTGWHARAPDAPRPLYGLNRLSHAAAGATVILCEGEKAADAAQRQFPDAVGMAWPGGANADGDADFSPLKGREVILWPDADKPGVAVMDRITKYLPQARIVDTADLPGGYDAADLERDDIDDPEAWLNSRLHSKQQPRGTPYGRLLVLSVDDIDTAPARSYLLKGLISPGEVSIWVGPPKCGKSFLLLYIAYMLSLGRSVFGRRVKPTRVLYVAAEGEAGIANRIRALRIKYRPSENFHFIAQPADLLHDNGDKADLIAAAQAHQAQLIVLDTLSRLLAGGDENSPQDMGTFVRNVAEVRHDTGAHIAIVHHGTKASNGSNPRGHSCLTGADDALIEVLKLEDGSRQATVIHAKDDADGMRWGFKLELVELGADDDGDPITTLLTTEMAEPPPAAGRQERLSDNLQIGLRTLQAAMKAHATLATVGEDHAEQSVVTEADWRAWFYREGKPGESQDAKQKAFRRIVDGLLAKGLIGSRDGFIWPTERRS